MRTDIRVDTSQLQALAARLKSVNDKVKTKQLRGILKQAAKPVLVAVQAATPVRKGLRDKKTGRFKKSKRKPINKYGTTRGNLKRSMDIFVGKKGIAVHVGAAVDEGFAKKGKKGWLQTDGYYNFMLNFGTKYRTGTYHMDKAENASLPLAERLATVEMKKYLTKVINRTK